MSEGVFDFSGAERVDVEADVFAAAAVAVSFKDSDLIEGAAEICAPKRFVLIKFQAVLVVEMERPEFPEGHGKIDFIGRIKAGENGVRGFDQCAYAFWIGAEL